MFSKAGHCGALKVNGCPLVRRNLIFRVPNELRHSNASENAGLPEASIGVLNLPVVVCLYYPRFCFAPHGRVLLCVRACREHEGSLVRHEIYVFLDVTWLAKILKPLLNHRDTEDFDGSLSLGDTGITLEGDAHISSWSRFKENGILEMTLARVVLWPDGLSDYVLPTLESLGLAHPIDGDPAQRLGVLVRLGEERPPDVGEELDDFRRDHTAVLNVTWKVFMGVPPGSIEKVLVRCSTIGALRTFWRFGVLVQGCLGGGGVASKTFALLVEYTHERNEIDMRVYGNIGTAAPWAALSLGISAVRTMCLDFPGLRWRASLKCPQHQQANMPITNKVRTAVVVSLLLTPYMNGKFEIYVI